ncbi:MAG: TrbI/VirB10 family protein [Pseudomonadota bacterium]
MSNEESVNKLKNILKRNKPDSTNNPNNLQDTKNTIQENAIHTPSLNWDKLKEKLFSIKALYILIVIIIGAIVMYYYIFKPNKVQNQSNNTLIEDFNIKNIPNNVHVNEKEEIHINKDHDLNPEHLEESSQQNEKTDDNNSEKNTENNTENNSENNTENNSENNTENNSKTNNLSIPIPDPIIDDSLDDQSFSPMIVFNNSQEKVAPQITRDTSIVSNILKYQHKGQLSQVISQGTIVKGYLTSAINTDFGGNVVQAIIANDIYAAGGYNKILVPKGSKILGKYNPNFNDIGRLLIEWYRFDLPNGQVITITNSPSVDTLLRNGANAKINKKHLSLLKSITVLSALNIGLAFGADKMDYWLSPNSTSNTENSLNNTLTELETLKRNKQGSTTRIEDTLKRNLSADMRNKVDNTNIDNAISDVDKLIRIQRSNRTSEAISSTQQEFGNVLREIFQKINPTPCATIKQGDQIQIYIMEDLLIPKKPNKNN